MNFYELTRLAEGIKQDLDYAHNSWNLGEKEKSADILREIVIDLNDLRKQAYQRYLMVAAHVPALRNHIPDLEHCYWLAMAKNKELKQQLPETEHFYREALDHRSTELKEKGGDA